MNYIPGEVVNSAVMSDQEEGTGLSKRGHGQGRLLESDGCDRQRVDRN